MKTMTVVIAALVLGSVGCGSATTAKTSREAVVVAVVEAAPSQQLGRSFDFEPVTITGKLPGRSFHFEPVTIVVKHGAPNELALGR